jgi:hypothetical protein
MSEDEAARFRQQAEECRQQAEKAISPLDKEAWLRTAGEWTKLAQSAEGRRRG